MRDLTQRSSGITSTGQLKFTQLEISYLQNFLDAGDRGGYYMALYNMTGNTQCLEQAQVSTFSQGTGGAAWLANLLLQTGLPRAEYAGVYYLSQKVAQESLRAMQIKLGLVPHSGNVDWV